MKHIFYLAMVAALVVSAGCKREAADQAGSIVGLVSNDLQHELQRAKITLTNNAGKKETTETGSDGMYEFQNLALGQTYTVVAEVSGYHTDTLSTLVDRMGVRGDFVLKEIALRLSKTSIDVGTNDYADFIIYNDSQRDMVWTIDKNVDWLTLSKTSGTIQPKGAEPIHIIVDRQSGTHEAKLVVNSSHEYVELTITATSKLPTIIIYMPSITSVIEGNAKLVGWISSPPVNIGSAYYEGGFVVSESPQPTLQNASKYIGVHYGNHIGQTWDMTVNLNGHFRNNHTYYIRGYVTSYADGTAYSNEIRFDFP